MSQDLASKTCFACEGGTPPMPADEVAKYIKRVNDDWWIIENHHIIREFTFENFKESMEFVNKVADIAEHEGHHPDIYIFYNRTKLELTTHAAKGLTENDFIMAAKIDQLS
jgi:4a-hydroxytetrahydrobiopterin dehydratase